ncbi:MAG: DnaJ domain-containing protein [Holosporales bacterium]
MPNAVNLDQEKRKWVRGTVLPEEPSTSTKQQEPLPQEPEVKKNKTPYEILGVTENATQEEIKKAFREQAKQCNVQDLRSSSLLKLVAV